MSRKSHDEKLQDAKRHSQRWLQEVDNLERRGIRSGPAHEHASRKAEFWLHRFNVLVTNAEG